MSRLPPWRACSTFTSADLSDVGYSYHEGFVQGANGSRSLLLESETMKILQVVPGMSPHYGGPNVALTDLTRLLTERGFETTLMTTNSDPSGRIDVPLGVMTSQRGANVMYFNMWPAGRYAFSMALAKSLFQNINNYDVVHIHWLYSFSSLIAAIAAQYAHVPYVFQPNGSLDPYLMKKNRWLKNFYNTIWGNYIIQHAAGIIFTSEAECNFADLHKANVPEHVVPVGLDWKDYAILPSQGQFRKQYPAVADKKIILFLGRISRQKGLDLLIPAFHAVKSRVPNAHLVIAGPDSEGYGETIRQLIGEFNLEDSVTWVGYLSREMKLAAYVDCDLYVLPSYAENFGATVTEALACEKPVVITNRVNICDEIEKAQAGIVVECAVESIVNGMRLVLEDPNLSRQLGQKGRKLVQQKYTWDVVLRELITVYQGVAVQ